MRRNHFFSKATQDARAKRRREELETLRLIVDLYERWHRPAEAAEWRAKLPKQHTHVRHAGL